MAKMNQLIFFIGLMLVMTTCMTGTAVKGGKMNHFWKYLSKKLQDTDCITTTVRNQACHEGRCHNTTTYIHGCDTYDQLWDNLTVHFNVHNSTGWRNTTCSLRAAWEPANNDPCGFANMTFQSCTNGDCRSGIIDIHACIDSFSSMNHLRDASTFSGVDVDDGVGDFFDIPCINLLFDTVRLRRFDSGKKEHLT